MPEAGLEPAQYCYRRILSPLRLPISPLGHVLVYYKTFNQFYQYKLLNFGGNRFSIILGSENMSNILDYLQWRGDLSLQAAPFNSVDSLILARAAYFRWELILDKRKELTICEAYEKFKNLDPSSYHNLAEEDPSLFELMATSERFKNGIVSDFINDVDEKKETQFCAVVFQLSDQTLYISFRGTDNTVVGWKEDLNMSFQDCVPSQHKAKRYINRIAKKYQHDLRIGGHSKGGNLAVYSSLYMAKKYLRRVIEIDNFDGPGLSSVVMNEKKQHPFFQIIKVFYPQNSVIGRLLFHEENNRHLIQSVYKGIYQHDLYSWQVMGKEFVSVNEFKKGSEIVDGAIKQFLLEVPAQQRKQCIDLIFDVISSTNADTFHELSTNLMMKAPMMIKSMTQVESVDRKMMMETLKILTDLIVDEMKSMNKNE